MGFLELIKKLFIKEPKRNVARLSSISEDQVDTVDESVDLSGKPLREKHLRRALRDRRLLPKKKPAISMRAITGAPRKRYLTRGDAGRLFSGTLRTHNRSNRDLLADEEQLKRYGLPIIRTEEELAAALGITVGELRFFSVHREKEERAHYVTYVIPKRSGGERIIMAPKKRLKAIQRKLLGLIVDRLPVSDAANGFRSGRSVRTNAEAHVGRAVVVNLDLKDFFPSIHVGRVRGLLIALGYGYWVATVLAVLMTEAERQPVVIDGKRYFVPVTSRYCVQGAPTSPGISNAVVLRMDRRLKGLSKSLGFAYSRYADDLTFSGDGFDNLKKLITLASRIVREEGFSINRRKTRVMRKGRRQAVTGVVVNSVAGLPRSERRKLRAEIHRLRKEKEDGRVNPAEVASLKGKLAYLSMLNREQAEKLKSRLGPL